MSEVVLVIGDEMQDLYILGSAERVSPEAPVLVVKAAEQQLAPGGAGNVRQNLLSLGVEAKILRLAPPAPLPLKVRVMASGQQLLRVDFNDRCVEVQGKHLQQVMEDETFKAIVVSDYGKGAVGPSLLEALRAVALPTFVDTKGDPSRWWGVATVLFPNAHEYEAHAQAYERFPNVVVKCGEEGILRLLYGESVQYEAGIPTQVRSVVGAGDSVLAAFVAAWVDGASIEQATAYANAAGAASVSGEGTTSVSRQAIAEMEARRDVS